MSGRLATAAGTSAGDTTPALVLGPVNKTYVAHRVLTDAELVLRPGEVHALLGGNGSGKSTMIKILAGVEQADPGGWLTVGTDGRSLDSWTPADAAAAHLRFIHQDLALVPDLTVAENLFLGTGLQARGAVLSWRRLRAAAQEVLDRFGVDVGPQMLVGDLSLIQQTLLATARALHDVGDDARAVLVLDEPTAALPPAQADELLDAVRGHADRGHSVVVVTHRLGEVVRVSDRVTVLRNGVVVHARALRDASEADIGRLITGDDAHPEEQLAAATQESGSPRLAVRALTAPGLAGVDLTVAPGEVVGIADAGGRSGNALVDVLFGVTRPEAGEVVLDGAPVDRLTPRRAMDLGIAYVPGRRLRDALFPGLSVATNTTIASLTRFRRSGLVDGRTERRSVRDTIARFRVQPADPGQDVVRLSGGNQQKVSVARWMVRTPSLLLLEDPTQGVDIGARTEIWALIAQAVDDGASVLVVSSDYQELATHCGRVLVFSRGRLRSTLRGSAISVPAIARAVHDA